MPLYRLDDIFILLFYCIQQEVGNVTSRFIPEKR